jgi:Mycothiol maleylpyruvate isomerase N-terminal domain
MTLNRVQALRTQRQLVLDYGAGLSDDDWSTPSQAAGWRVRDVIAHMGATCRGLFSRLAITLLFSDDTEQTNEELLAPRRAWPAHRVLDEFARWSMAFIAAASAAGQPLLGSTPLRVGSLGRYPLQKLASMLVFDWHTPHLRSRTGTQQGRPCDRRQPACGDIGMDADRTRADEPRPDALARQIAHTRPDGPCRRQLENRSGW